MGAERGVEAGTVELELGTVDADAVGRGPPDPEIADCNPEFGSVPVVVLVEPEPGVAGFGNDRSITGSSSLATASGAVVGGRIPTPFRLGVLESGRTGASGIGAIAEPGFDDPIRFGKPLFGSRTVWGAPGSIAVPAFEAPDVERAEVTPSLFPAGARFPFSPRSAFPSLSVFPSLIGEPFADEAAPPVGVGLSSTRMIGPESAGRSEPLATGSVERASPSSTADVIDRTATACPPFCESFCASFCATTCASFVASFGPIGVCDPESPPVWVPGSPLEPSARPKFPFEARCVAIASARLLTLAPATRTWFVPITSPHTTAKITSAPRMPVSGSGNARRPPPPRPSDAAMTFLINRLVDLFSFLLFNTRTPGNSCLQSN